MTISPVDSRSHWIPPKELYRWLNSPYQADLELVFPHPLAKIISQYADYNLGKNGKNWYVALIRLGVLPDRIPPLPLNINETLDRDCPMHLNRPNLDGTYKKIKDTHFLCLIPAGRIDTLAERKFGAWHKCPYLSAFHYGPALHDPDMTSFNEPEWVLIANILLPGSENMDYAEQDWIANRFVETTDIPYEIPSIKHALATNLLYAAAEKKGLWESLSTRVKETFYWETTAKKGWWETPSDKRTLIIVDPYSADSAEIGVDQVIPAFRSHQLGITVLWKITKPTPKSPSSCSVS
jgi:hypothetical protein